MNYTRGWRVISTKRGCHFDQRGEILRDAWLRSCLKDPSTMLGMTGVALLAMTTKHQKPPTTSDGHRGLRSLRLARPREGASGAVGDCLVHEAVAVVVDAVARLVLAGTDPGVRVVAVAVALGHAVGVVVHLVGGDSAGTVVVFPVAALRRSGVDARGCVVAVARACGVAVASTSISRRAPPIAVVVLTVAGLGAPGRCPRRVVTVAIVLGDPSPSSSLELARAPPPRRRAV